MNSSGAKYAITRLRMPELAFDEKLNLVKIMVPQVDNVSGVIMVRLLLDSALHSRPSLTELYELCEAVNSTELLQDYLRGFFLVEGADEKRREMAERLEEVISFRMSQNKCRGAERKLKHTIAAYLMKNRN